MNSLSNCVGSLALVAVIAPLGAGGSAGAAMVYNGNIKAAIPSTGGGLYVDIDNGFTTSTTAMAGWDLNIVGLTGDLSLTGPEGALNLLRFPASSGPSAGRFAGGAGSVVDASGSYGAGSVVFGTGAGEWRVSGTNYFGFRFTIDGATHYGWGMINIHPTGWARLDALAYETDAGVATYVSNLPAPGAIALLGLAGLAGRRRRD
ncbi:MAG: hypothetical protein GC172_10135 [Phycisphaera sp.]|nr:hypothetical protein [Phycisphaera sp.]